MGTIFKMKVVPLCLAILATLFGCAYMQSAIAQEDALEQAQEVVFNIERFNIIGESPLRESHVNNTLSAYLLNGATFEDVKKAASELEDELVSKGYSFYRVVIPPQTLNSGTVNLKIERLTIADIKVLGNTYFSDRNIKNSLPMLRLGESPNLQTISDGLVLAGINPSKNIRVGFVKSKSPRAVDAEITVEDSNPNSVFLWANNAGSRLTTDARVGLQYQNRNVWGRDHLLSLSYTFSPEKSSELQQYGLNYQIPFYDVKGVMNVFYSQSDADSGLVAGTFEVSGAGEVSGLSYTQHLPKIDAYQHFLNFSIVDKLFENEVIFGSRDIGADVRSRPFSVGYGMNWDSNNWLLNANVSYIANLNGGRLNDSETYNSVRRGADSQWAKQTLSVRANYKWSQYWSTNVLLFGQNSSDLLISGEQFGLGGGLPDAGPRGFYERESVADKGYKLSLEMNRSLPRYKMQAGVFLDFASGRNNRPQAGEQASEKISSVGVQWLWWIGNAVLLEAEYGYVLDGFRQVSGGNLTDDGDSRVHLSLKYFPKWFGDKN